MKIIAGESSLEGVPTRTLATEDGRARFAVAPSLGGLGAELVLDGVSWLFRNTRIPLSQRLRAPGLDPASERYVRYADVGLGDFCLLAVSGDAVLIPGDAEPTPIQDHGLAWSARDVKVAVDGATLTTRWSIFEAPFSAELVRESTLVSPTELRAIHHFTNRGRVALPAFWSSHDMLELTDDTEYVIEAGTEMVVFHSEGDLELRCDTVHRWPMFETSTGGSIDLSKPGAIRASFAAKIFSLAPSGPVRLARGGAWLELSSREASHIAIWTNNRAWTPQGVPRGAYRNLCMERASSPTDRVSAAQTDWVRPGSRRDVTLIYRAGAV